MEQNVISTSSSAKSTRNASEINEGIMEKTSNVLSSFIVKLHTFINRLRILLILEPLGLESISSRLIIHLDGYFM